MTELPRIVVLDAHTTNPGDLDWASMEALGSCEFFPRTTPDQVLERARGAAILITNKTVLSAAIIQALPDLRYIGLLATGTNVVDLAAARERGITVANVPGYSTASVAQLTFALLLELTFHVGRHAASVRAGRWSAAADFCFSETPLLELAGRTFGIVGYGAIGAAVARIAQAFGMNVLASTRRARAAEPGVEFTSIEEVFRRADVVSLHCPLTPETQGLVNAERLSWMRPTAFLLNTGRGPLIDESALADALNAGQLAGAGLDVLSQEPPPTTNPLIAARNCLITPHIAWATHASRGRLLIEVVENIRAFLAGAPRNVVS